MTRLLTRLAAACAAALALAGATVPASASYLGYGNGDPGNWDFWTEQNGGHAPSMPSHIRVSHSAPVHHHHATTDHSGPARAGAARHY